MKCEKCGGEMEEIDRCGFSRIYACRKCEPKLFRELDRIRGRKP